MSVGSVFQLITNNGVQDKLLMATEALNARIKEIMKTDVVVNEDGSARRVGSWNSDLLRLDRTHTVFVAGYFKPFASAAYEYIKVPVSEGHTELGESVRFRIPQVGQFYSDMVVHIQLQGLRAVSALDKVRYAAFLGHKIFPKVAFSINGNPIDDYTTDEYNAYWQFKLPAHKRAGWLKNVGQEIPSLGYLTPDPTTDEFREYRWIGTGNQTFKREHTTVDLWVPLLFWFKDMTQAIPSMVIPYGQTYVDLNLAKASDLIAFANYGGGGAYTSPSVKICNLYVNNIFVSPELTDLFLSKFGFSLIRVHKRHTKMLISPVGTERLNNLTWPIETMYLCFRPRANLMDSQAWYKCMALTDAEVPTPVVTGGLAPTISINNINYYTETPVVTELQLKAHDVEIYKEFPSAFFNQYIPFIFGNYISTPTDDGWFMMNFNMRPGDRNPSGHFNLSRAREFYLSYKSSSISQANPSDLTVLADALNFLVVKGASAVLKFST